MCKQTLLHDKQVELGAKMVPFAGWEMPVSYSNIIEEHHCVRNDVGLFDVSHMGEVFISGKDALAFLQKLVPQSIDKLTPLKAVYCQLTNDNGGIIDDLIIYKLEDNKYFLIVNASRIDEDINWMIRNQIGYDVVIDNQSHNYSLLAVQGPKASALMEKMGVKKDDQPPFFSIKPANINGVDIWLSRTGYTGEDGFEILIPNKYAQNIWDYVIEKGQEFGLKPIGLGARDTLRLEAALHLYGNDLDTTTSPIEAGLAWSVSKNKLEDYNGKDVILSQLANGVSRKLVGFKMLSKIPARHDYEVYYNDEIVGKVTSGVPSPTLGENIGLAYVKTSSNINIGSIIQVMIRNKLYDAKVVARPFVAKKNKV